MAADEFLSEVLPLMVEEAVGIHDGDPTARLALWSHDEPVTLFGAEMTRRGWNQLDPAFRWLAGTFTGSVSCQYEVLSAGSSGDLGYVVAIEHSVAARHGAPAREYALRVTTVFRREAGAWKVVHRHGDGYNESNALPSED